MHNHCFHADESYRERTAYGDAPAVIVVERDKPGYTVYATTMSQQEAVDMVAQKNAELGLTADEILEIRASSMRASRFDDERDHAETEPGQPGYVPMDPAKFRDDDLPSASNFDFTVTTAEGATFTPWTDGYAIGYKVTAPGLPDRYLFFNPSSDTGEDIFHTNAFVYLEADPADQVNTHHHYDIWDTTDVEPDADDLSWARDDLGSDATDDEVRHVANERAIVRAKEARD